MNNTAPAPVQFDDVLPGDTLRFVRIFRGFEYPGGEMKTLTETVERVTANTVFFTSGKRLTRKKWGAAEVHRISMSNPTDEYTDEYLDRYFFGPEKTASNVSTTPTNATPPKTIYDLPIAEVFWKADARDMNC